MVTNTAPARVLRGMVHLQAETAAPLWLFWRRVLELWRREAEF
ncbi:MAG: hypothetical protein OIF57_01565 [Marinobacterium sp.]|nr:hypothetical protein [Marinobacterium sp.]